MDSTKPMNTDPQSNPNIGLYSQQFQTFKNGNDVQKIETIREGDKVTQKIQVNNGPMQTKQWDLTDPKVQDAIKSGLDGPQKAYEFFKA